MESHGLQVRKGSTDTGYGARRGQDADVRYYQVSTANVGADSTKLVASSGGTVQSKPVRYKTLKRLSECLDS